jgi:hypothetical protein
MTREDYWSQWDDIRGIVVVTELIHLDSMISALSAHDEIHNYLDWFIEIAAGRAVDGIIYYKDYTSMI